MGHHGGQRGRRPHQHGLAHHVRRLPRSSGPRLPRSAAVLWCADAGAKERWEAEVCMYRLLLPRTGKTFKAAWYVLLFFFRSTQGSCSLQETGGRWRSEAVPFGPWSKSKSAFGSSCKRGTHKPAASTRQSSTSTCGPTPSSTTKRWPTFPYTTHGVHTTDGLRSVQLLHRCLFLGWSQAYLRAKCMNAH